MDGSGAGRPREDGATTGEQAHGGARRGALGDAATPAADPTLEHPRCVFQLLQAPLPPLHARDGASRSAACRASCSSRSPRRCATTRAASARRRSATPSAGRSTRSACSTSAPRRSSSCCSGNIGRPGGGILALRGHASIQGSTDIPTLYNILPGYLPMPHAQAAPDPARATSSTNAPPTGFWGHMRRLHGQPAEGVVGRRRHRRRTTSASTTCRASPATTRPTRRALRMRDGEVKGFFVHRARTRPSARPTRSSTGSRWRSSTGSSCATSTRSRRAAFWHDAPEIETGELRTEDIGTEVFFLPGRGAHREGRHVHQHPAAAAVAPQGGRAAGRLPLRAVVRLPPRAPHPREARRARPSRRDRAVLELTWDYPTEGPHDEPSAEAVLREINGCATPTAARCPATPSCKADGSTACGCWIYCGCYADGVNQTARRKPGSEQTWVAPEWGWAWPTNRRILYNRASADPDGRPWSERKRYVWWDAGAGPLDRRRRARLQGRHAARLRAARGRRGPRTPCAATSRSSCRPTAAAGCSSPQRPRRRPAARRTTSRTSRRSTTRSTPSSANPARQRLPAAREPVRTRAGSRERRLPVRDHHLPADRAPHRRRHVAHAAATWPSCSRRCSARSARSWRASAASSTAAGRRSSRPRTAIEARVMVTERITPLRGRRPRRAPGRPALPLGHRRPRRRATRANDLFALVARPERAHPGGEGGDLRHPPGPPAARRRRCWRWSVDRAYEGAPCSRRHEL